MTKIGGNWVTVLKAFKKDERGWNEVTDYESLFENGELYFRN